MTRSPGPGAGPPVSQVFAQAMGATLGPDFPQHLGLAVSGGGDSMAMLHLAADWAHVYGIRLWVVTVDHGLRPESAAEAALVACAAAERGLPHSTLRWQGWDRSGNLQDAARRARLDLIGRWRGVVQHVLMAHTLDDQAETVLMRLARGSGVEGLAAMAALHRVGPTPDDAVPPPDPLATPSPRSAAPPGHGVTLRDTSVTPLDNWVTPPDTSITPPDTSVTPPDASVRPPDASVRPCDPSLTPPDGSAAPPGHGVTLSDASLTPPLPPLIPSGQPAIRSGPGVEVAAAPPASAAVRQDWFILRPLLGVSRAALRHYVRVLHIPFVDDPSNADPRFDRVRIRALLDPLAAEGLTRDRLADTAARMRRARVALGARAHDVAGRIATERLGCILFDRDALPGVEADTQLRLLAAAIQNVTSDPYRPRESALESALDRVLGGGAATLHGAMLVPHGASLWVTREHAAVATVQGLVGPGMVWDRRWHLHGPAIDGLTSRALGPDGLAQVKRPDGVPVPVLLACPSVWRGDRLIACLSATFGPDHAQERHPPGGTFPNRLLSH